MDKIFDLLDTAIAVVLVVIALSLQLYDNHQVTKMTELKTSSYSLASAEQNHLSYHYNGMELIAHLSIVASKNQKKLIYQGNEYQYGNFIKDILGVELLSEEGRFRISPEQRAQLERQNYQIYQQDNQWRIEN